MMIDKERRPSSLTDKEYLFANYYLGEANLNATEAAKLAGYSHNTARQQGSRMLTNVDIKDYIHSKSSEILEGIGVTQERILSEIAKIAFTDINEFFNDDWSLKKVGEISKGKTGAIKSIKKSENGVAIQMHDKIRALITLWELVKNDVPIR